MSELWALKKRIKGKKIKVPKVQEHWALVSESALGGDSSIWQTDDNEDIFIFIGKIT